MPRLAFDWRENQKFFSIGIRTDCILVASLYCLAIIVIYAIAK